LREAFRRSEEFLDLEVKQLDPILNQKEQLRAAIINAAPQKVQEMLKIMGVCKS
jgi:hypothetical protein